MRATLIECGKYGPYFNISPLVPDTTISQKCLDFCHRDYSILIGYAMGLVPWTLFIIQLVAAWLSRFHVLFPSYFSGWSSASCWILLRTLLYLFIHFSIDSHRGVDGKNRICIFNASTNHAEMTLEFLIWVYCCSNTFPFSTIPSFFVRFPNRPCPTIKI